MLRGLKDQLAADGHNKSDGSLLMTGHCEDKDHDWGTYYDNLSNLPLRSDLIDKARQEEMEVITLHRQGRHRDKVGGCQQR